MVASLLVEGAAEGNPEGSDVGDEREEGGSKEAEEVATGGDLKLGGEQGTRLEALGDPIGMLLGVLGDPTGMLLACILGLRTGLPNGALILR